MVSDEGFKHDSKSVFHNVGETKFSFERVYSLKQLRFDVKTSFWYHY